MAKKKGMSLSFDGLDGYIKQLNELDANVDAIAEEALTKSFHFITDGAREAIKPHHRTGDTEAELLDTPILSKDGGTIYVDVGFKLPEGLASQYLIYGTEVGGTPRQDPDKEMRDAFFSKATQDGVKEIQQRIFSKELNKKLGGK